MTPDMAMQRHAVDPIGIEPTTSTMPWNLRGVGPTSGFAHCPCLTARFAIRLLPTISGLSHLVCGISVGNPPDPRGPRRYRYRCDGCGTVYLTWADNSDGTADPVCSRKPPGTLHLIEVLSKSKANLIEARRERIRKADNSAIRLAARAHGG
jgi:hypothetical protein